MSIHNIHRVDDHDAFLMGDLLPAVVGYADSKEVPPEVVAFAVLLAMAAMLQANGVGRDTIVHAVGAMPGPKRRVIEARESEQPGQAFLLGIGYWPLSAPTAKE